VSRAKRVASLMRDVFRAIGAQLREEQAAERASLVGAQYVRRGEPEVWRVAMDTGTTVLLRSSTARQLLRRDELNGDTWLRVDRIHGTTPTEGDA